MCDLRKIISVLDRQDNKLYDFKSIYRGQVNYDNHIFGLYHVGGSGCGYIGCEKMLYEDINYEEYINIEINKKGLLECYWKT